MTPLLYLAKVSLEITRYMCDTPETKELLIPVYANSAEEAEQKVKAFYEAQNEAYAITYWPTIEIQSPIV